MNAKKQISSALLLILLSFIVSSVLFFEQAEAQTVGVGGDCPNGNECLQGLTCLTTINPKKCIRPSKKISGTATHGNSRVGEPCDPNNTTAANSNCASEKCDGTNKVCLQPTPNSVPIGFACDTSRDCKIGTSSITPLCDGSSDPIDGGTICKGNSSDTGCENGTPSANNWCQFGLVCNTSADVCTNDFGAGEAEKVQLGEATGDIRVQINRVINIFLSFLAIVGVILIVYGGILWSTAAGNDDQVGKARKTIIAASIGLIVIGVAWTIISFVINISGTIS